MAAESHTQRYVSICESLCTERYPAEEAFRRTPLEWRCCPPYHMKECYSTAGCGSSNVYLRPVINASYARTPRRGSSARTPSPWSHIRSRAALVLSDICGRRADLPSLPLFHPLAARVRTLWSRRNGRRLCCSTRLPAILETMPQLHWSYVHVNTDCAQFNFYQLLDRLPPSLAVPRRVTPRHAGILPLQPRDPQYLRTQGKRVRYHGRARWQATLPYTLV